eukprot:c53644_g1_i1.p1 GENE.c53644_g1_i1~~c53644_g1_i1.p1  ORF type:complete len:536 (+),score=18.18 c53644_g1_i1:60-1667(+)
MKYSLSLFVVAVLVCFGSVSAFNRRVEAERSFRENMKQLVVGAKWGNSSINSTVLDEYIAFQDENFGYELSRTLTGSSWTTYQYIYTSVRYLNDSQVDRPIWKHQLSIIVPNNIVYPNVAFMLTDYGYNDEVSTPTGAATQVASSMGVIVGELRTVPNQVLCFTEPLPGDPFDGDYCLDEDFLMNYGMEWFMRGSLTPEENPLWLARLGMVKASVWANTILQEVAESLTGTAPQEFFIYGASKRGATVWLVAAVDERVIGVCPIVIDAANMHENAHRRYMSLGNRLFNDDNMYKRTIGYTDHPQGEPFGYIDDPYYYFGRLEFVNKLFQFAASDAYFEPDSTRWWWYDLPGAKYIRYTPMLHYDFYLRQTEQIVGNMIAWAKYIVSNRALPQIDWVVGEGTRNITVTVKSGGTPVKVAMYHLTNPESEYRTFSPLHGAPTNWVETLLSPISPGVYFASQPPPASGWTGFFMQLEFSTGYTTPNEETFRISSLVSVVPDVYPCPRIPPEYGNCGAAENCDWPMPNEPCQQSTLLIN